jgi:MYXO-CTERM domain-containing protein
MAGARARIVAGWIVLASAPAAAAPHPADGPILSVTRPTSFELDFGTIALGQLASRDVSIHNPGTAPLQVTLGAPGGPFTAPAEASIAPGATATFAVTCRSMTPLARVDEALTLTSNAQQSNTAAIDLHCAVADTRLEVTPGALDLVEVRRGAPPTMLAIVLENPGPDPMLLDHVRLAGAPPALRLAPETAEDQPLLAGEAFPLALTLTPAEERDLDGAKLSISVDGVALELPISGKVVTPAARVSPAALDLGTACIGTEVTGVVRLINSGTATLMMQQPELDRSFRALLDHPGDYPAALAPGTTATVGVTPETTMIGSIDGTLTWDVDAPAGPFSVPVTLRYIDAGTAISPRSAIFGSVEVAQTSPRQTITLENCNPQPIRLAIEGVTASAGDVDAWDVSPREDERTLGPRDKLQISAAFRPRRAGRHVAYIRVAIDGAPGEIELSGDALGGLPEPTSFYACSCSGGGAGSPAPGAPIAAAVLLVLRRRRRSCAAGAVGAVSAPSPSGSS